MSSVVRPIKIDPHPKCIFPWNGVTYVVNKLDGVEWEKGFAVEPQYYEPLDNEDPVQGIPYRSNHSAMYGTCITNLRCTEKIKFSQWPSTSLHWSSTVFCRPYFCLLDYDYVVF